MNKLENIDWEKVKSFIRGNTLLCALAILDVFLFFTAWERGNVNESFQEKISSLQIKEKQIKTNLGKLAGLEKHFEHLKNINDSVLKNCLNFGKKTTAYKFLKQIDNFLPGKKLSISNTSLYDINNARNINFNQDLSDFDGVKLMAYFNASFTGTMEDLTTFLKQLNELPYFINLQKLEMKSGSNGINMNLSFALLGKIQLRE